MPLRLVKWDLAEFQPPCNSSSSQQRNSLDAHDHYEEGLIGCVFPTLSVTVNTGYDSHFAMGAKIGRDWEMPLRLVTFITSRGINEGVKSINECRKTGKASGNPLTPLLWVREHSLMFGIFLGFTFGLLILSMVVDLPLVE